MDFPADNRPLILDVCCVDDTPPFICGIYGPICLEDFIAMESELIEFIKDQPKPEGRHRVVVTFFSGQSGEEGRWEIPPHWEFDFTDYRKLST